MAGRGMKKTISVQLFVALTVVCVTAVFGSVLAWQNFRSVKNVMLVATSQTVQHLSQALDERRRWLVDPPRNLLRFMAYNPVVHATTLSQRLERLPQFAESLQFNDMLSAVYVGYPNGEFLLVRKLFVPVAKAYFSAPEDSAYLVQAVTLEPDGSLTGQWRFYDEQLNLLQATQKPDYQFDPRTRSWYTQALEEDDTVVSSPYVFHTTRQLGYTLSQRAANSQAVIGMDISIYSMNKQLRSLIVTENSEVALVDSDGRVLAYPDGPRLSRPDEGEEVNLPHISDLGSASLLHLFQSPHKERELSPYRIEGQSWYGLQAPMGLFDGRETRVMVAVPADELLQGAYQAFIRELVWIGVISLLFLLMGWEVARRISRPLRALADQVRTRSEFDFRRQPGVSSFITEIQELNDVLDNMSRTIADFQAIALALNHGTRLDKMLDAVVHRLVDTFNVESGAVYLVEEDKRLSTLATSTGGTDFPAMLAVDTGNDAALSASFDKALGDSGKHMYVPLKSYKQILRGVLVLRLKSDQQYTGGAERSFRRFVHEVSGAAAVAIETRQLIETQKQLLDGIIRLLANAIDAKSPYTGAHCERVPLLAEALLTRVLEDSSGPYAEFSMDETQRYEFWLAAWLHDCGKVSTPEEVMDKATKLEVRYNRIHEIRTRFEVLWRDAEISWWQGIANGTDKAILDATLQETRARLQQDFAFVAQANLGSESMDSADIERLEQIGTQRWWRHFDNRLGLAPHEKSRFGHAQETLPAQERLLADRSDHLVPWGERKPPVSKNDPANIWGFDMQVPEHAGNHGELYNLSIQKGTLTPEERFRINEHIVQTITMLSSLPLPPELKRLPHIAGTHHEKMDGTGYPRRLNHAQLGIPERVMMIADIFEALTAADRPYKRAKTLSESLDIMVAMACSGHIDPALLRLFVTSAIYREYGEKFLHPSQLDEVNVPAILAQLDDASRAGERACVQ